MKDSDAFASPVGNNFFVNVVMPTATEDIVVNLDGGGEFDIATATFEQAKERGQATYNAQKTRGKRRAHLKQITRRRDKPQAGDRFHLERKYIRKDST